MVLTTSLHSVFFSSLKNLAAINLSLNLVTQGLEDTAFQVLKSFPTSSLDTQDGNDIDRGNFFLKHCVNMEKVCEMTQDIQWT